MAGFEVIGDIKDGSLRKLPVSTYTGAIGDLIELAIGSTTWSACTAASQGWSRKAIVMETATAASSVLAYELNGSETVKAESNASGAAAANGDRMILTDTNTVNNTGTDNTSEEACFIQDGYAGAATDKRIVGRVIVGNGVDPAAT